MNNKIPNTNCGDSESPIASWIELPTDNIAICVVFTENRVVWDQRLKNIMHTGSNVSFHGEVIPPVVRKDRPGHLNGVSYFAGARDQICRCCGLQQVSHRRRPRCPKGLVS